MGSFNETCALSGLPITPGDKVKLVFLSESPFNRSRRGCYINDHYSLRTPPIDGEYADYGRCDFDEKQPVVDLIVKKFHEDLVEQPFGFNQYHDTPTPANATIHQILEAAWEGRLMVRDNLGTGEDKDPESFPTWRRVRDKLIAKKKKIQLGESDKAYNVQPIRRGIVCVHFNTYDHVSNKKKLEAVDKFLSKDYETKMVRERENDGDYALLVMPNGVSANPPMLMENESITLHWDMNNFPCSRLRYDNQKVFSVMIRQDVWDLYLKSKFDITWRDVDYSTEGFINRLNDYVKKQSEEPTDLFTAEEIAKMTKEELVEQSQKLIASIKRMSSYTMEVELRDTFQQSVGVTGLGKHFADMLASEYTDEQVQNFVRIFGEAAKVEFTKMGISATWFLPITSGQETAWETHKEIHLGLAEIAATEIKKWDEEYGEEEDD